MADSHDTRISPALHSSASSAATDDVDLFARLIAHLDALDGDADLEPSCGDQDQPDDDALPRHRFDFTLVGRMQ